MKAVRVLALLGMLLPAVARAQGNNEFAVERAAEPPKLDGILDDQVWTPAPMPTGQWVSYNPNRGDNMPDVYKTDVFIAYDDRNVYFAFHCYDNEPAKIRTNIAKRDAAFSDDWIALSLDSAGTGQSAYHLFSNPSASQMDALNTSASGEQFDADMVWFSAAKVTADGYIVEAQIPLQTLRFSGGDEVRMNLVLFRKVSRIGYSYAWPEMLPGQWVFDRPSRLIFSNLQPRRLVELLPSVTYGINQERETADAWSPADDKYNIGASGKLGITSGITLDGTINPDFSQVESDAFQVQVNQRFPVFFSEKRPFFMEGMGLFNIAGTGGDGNMRTAVHTRKIVDPIYGSKLTGTLGKTAFGVLNAVDDNPMPPFIDRGRAARRAEQGDDRRPRHLRVGAIRLRGRHLHAHLSRWPPEPCRRWRHLDAAGHRASFSATFLATRTTERDGDDRPATRRRRRTHTRRGGGSSTNQVEHYDEDFVMDTAFYNRTGFTGAWSFSEVSFYPKSSWIQRIHPFYFAKYGRDRIQDGDEDYLHTGIRFNVTRQGFFNFSHARGHETWQGTQVQGRQRLPILRQHAGHALAEHGRQLWRRPSDLLRRVDPFQGRSRNFGHRGHVPAEPAFVGEPRIQPRPLLAPGDRRERSTTSTSSTQDDISVRQAFPGAVAVAVRQLRGTRPDRSSRFVRVRARHRVSRRIWVAVREAGRCERLARAGGGGRAVSDRQPWAVSQGVVPEALLVERISEGAAQPEGLFRVGESLDLVMW